LQQLLAVFEVADTVVAGVTEKAAHAFPASPLPRAARMVVIDGQPPASAPVLTAAYGTATTLRFKHCAVLANGQTKQTDATAFVLAVQVSAPILCLPLDAPHRRTLNAGSGRTIAWGRVPTFARLPGKICFSGFHSRCSTRPHSGASTEGGAEVHAACFS